MPTTEPVEKITPQPVNFTWQSTEFQLGTVRLVRVTFHSVNGEFALFFTKKAMELLRDDLTTRIEAFPPELFTPPGAGSDLIVVKQ